MKVTSHRVLRRGGGDLAGVRIFDQLQRPRPSFAARRPCRARPSRPWALPPLAACRPERRSRRGPMATANAQRSLFGATSATGTGGEPRAGREQQRGGQMRSSSLAFADAGRSPRADFGVDLPVGQVHRRLAHRVGLRRGVGAVDLPCASPSPPAAGHERSTEIRPPSRLTLPLARCRGIPCRSGMFAQLVGLHGNTRPRAGLALRCAIRRGAARLGLVISMTVSVVRHWPGWTLASAASADVASSSRQGGHDRQGAHGRILVGFGDSELWKGLPAARKADRA